MCPSVLDLSYFVLSFEINDWSNNGFISKFNLDLIMETGSTNSLRFVCKTSQNLCIMPVEGAANIQTLGRSVVGSVVQ